VAEGAQDLKVRMALQQAVETVLQLSSKKVDVFPMEKE
jgi:stage III sporulation protein AG